MKKTRVCLQKILSCLLLCLLVISFCSCNGDTTTPEITSTSTETTFVASSTEPQTFTINGDAISEWTIAVHPLTAPTEAEPLVHAVKGLLAIYTDEQIATVSTEDLTGDEKNLIIIGGTGRKADLLYPFSGNYYLSEIDQKGSVISLISTEKDEDALIAIFKEQLVEKTKDGITSLVIPEHEYIRFSVEDDYSPWHLKNEKETVLSDGVTYLAQRFVDEDGKPYCTYALILDPTKVEISMGSSNDGYALVPKKGDRQTTQEHMEAAVANGKNVIAGVNANFFDINGDYSPNGLALKDGVLINRAGTTQPFFAVTEEGEYIIDEAGMYRRYESRGKKFVHGVAGNEILLSDGLLTSVVDAEGLHPRTLVGLCEDGRIILGVIDGRQPKHSNGASYASSAIWMRSLGARTVMNLDGGGSSGFVLRDPETNHYDVCNSPSDGNLRKIYNSLLISIKES